jgi:hypothetical protein
MIFKLFWSPVSTIKEQISFENKNIDFVFGKSFCNHHLKVRAGAFKSEKNNTIKTFCKGR